MQTLEDNKIQVIFLLIGSKLYLTMRLSQQSLVVANQSIPVLYSLLQR